MSARTVVGAGEATVLLEVRGASVRIKRRGAPDVYLPLSAARDVAAFLLAAARQDAPSAARA